VDESGKEVKVNAENLGEYFERKPADEVHRQEIASEMSSFVTMLNDKYAGIEEKGDQEGEHRAASPVQTSLGSAHHIKAEQGDHRPRRVNKKALS